MRVFCHRHILKLFLTNIFVDHDDKRTYSVCHWLSSHHEAQTEARSDVSENMPVLQSASSHLPVTTALWPQRVCRRYVAILQHVYCVSWKRGWGYAEESMQHFYCATWQHAGRWYTMQDCQLSHSNLWVCLRGNHADQNSKKPKKIFQNFTQSDPSFGKHQNVSLILNSG